MDSKYNGLNEYQNKIWEEVNDYVLSHGVTSDDLYESLVSGCYEVFEDKVQMNTYCERLAVSYYNYAINDACNEGAPSELITYMDWNSGTIDWYELGEWLENDVFRLSCQFWNGDTSMFFIMW